VRETSQARLQEIRQRAEAATEGQRREIRRVTMGCTCPSTQRAGYQARRLNVGESLALAALMAEEARRVSVHERIPYNEPQTWYFTFGFAHEHAGHYVRVEGMGGDEAREAMFAAFGREWGFQYDDAGWFKHGVSQAERYGLTELGMRWQ
jgi:hypothetical protein